MAFIETLVEGKILVKALIDTSSKFNTVSRRLFNKLEEDYGLEGISDDDLIGEEIKCLDLQFYYKGKAKMSFGFFSETCNHNAKIVIDGMSIPLIEKNSNRTSSTKNNLFDSSDSETETNSSNFNFYNCPRKKKCMPSHFMTTSNLRPKSDLTLEELTNMLKKLSLRGKDNKY
ncbi:1721_t:CDS:2 [Cetraspora pellucida]|uniref:1721_t:CDS:1 n=1 Tax=Cetraspora pellucida TaxID=1433469 RepID=A0ACA9M2F7_9GLOM|nr:1721_t:CDS:2 [Cetraspora pellucida]